MHLVQIRARQDGRFRQAAQAMATPSKGEPFWSGKNGDVLRTGASQHSAPSALESGPAWSWHAPGLDIVRAAPLIDADKNVFVTTIGSGLYKFSEAGQLLWQAKFPADVPVVPAMLNGTVFVVTKAGHVHAVDAETGKEIWKSAALCRDVGSDTAAVTAAESTVVVSVCTAGDMGGGHDIVALNAADGSEKWRFKPVEMSYNFLGAVQDGKLVFAASTGHVYVLSLANGTQLWGRMSNHYIEEPSFSTGGAVLGPNGVVYVTANTREIRDMLGQKPDTLHGRIVAFRLVDGWRLWEADLPCEANSGPAVGRLGKDGGGPLSVVFGCGANPGMPLASAHAPQEGTVYAFDAETGEQRWRHEMPVLTVSGARGDSLLHMCLPDSFSNPAIGGDGTAYIGFMDGSLIALRETGELEADGTQAVGVSSFDAEAAFQGSPGIAPGMLVATPCNGVHVWLGSV